MTEISFSPSPAQSADLRRAFGRFGTGVTVITTQAAIGPLGFTANSFSSVSLDPALVLWSMGKASQRHDAFATASHYAVHVLRADQLPLAGHFARQGQGFDEIAHEMSGDGVPLLHGTLARFECRAYDCHSAGDHSILIGEVLRATVSEGTGLAFDQGRYGQFQEH